MSQHWGFSTPHGTPQVAPWGSWPHPHPQTWAHSHTCLPLWRTALRGAQGLAFNPGSAPYWWSSSALVACPAVPQVPFYAMGTMTGPTPGSVFVAWVTVTECHGLSGLKLLTSILSRFQRQEDEIRCQQHGILPGSLRGHLSQATPSVGGHGPASVFLGSEMHHSHPCLCCYMTASPAGTWSQVPLLSEGCCPRLSAHLHQHGLAFTRLHLQTPGQVRPHAQVPGRQEFFWRGTFYPRTRGCVNSPVCTAWNSSGGLRVACTPSSTCCRRYPGRHGSSHSRLRHCLGFRCT